MDKIYDDPRVREALELLNEVASEKKAHLQEMIANKYGNLRGLVEATSATARQEASKAFEAGKEKATEVAKEIDTNVRQNPWAYIGGAAAISLFIGFMLGRSRK